MPYAIVLTFDKESSLKISQVFKRFKDQMISPILYDVKMKPHITLSIYENINPDIVKERLTLFVIENESFKIQMSSLGYFPSEESILFLNPKTTKELLNFQQKIFGFFKDFEPETSPETWVPHCTVGIYIQMKNIGEAINIIKEEIAMTKETPFYVIVEIVSFVKFERNPLKIDWWLDYKLK